MVTNFKLNSLNRVFTGCVQHMHRLSHDLRSTWIKDTHKLQTHWVQEMGSNGVGIWTFPLIASRQRLQQEHLQPTPQRSNICFSALENQSIRNKMGLTPKHCHTAFSMIWPRKRQFLKQSVIHGTGKVSRHQMTPEHHLTTGSAGTGPSGTSPLLVLVSSESKRENISGNTCQFFKN